MSPHTKLAIRPSSLEYISQTIQNAYRNSWYGRPGPGFVDLPADLIQETVEGASDIQEIAVVSECSKGAGDKSKVLKIAHSIKTAKAPLVVIGKGAAYSKAELQIRELIEKSNLPFLPTPMGKGVLPDTHRLNAASARSTALKEADVVLILGARLNWILHFGDSPKWNPRAKFIQIDISPEEIGRNGGDASLSILGDLLIVVPQLLSALGPWFYDHSISPYSLHLNSAKSKNTAAALKKTFSTAIPMTYARAFSTIERILHSLSPPDQGGIVYVSEGANTMDISRSMFPVSYPRLRLDAGTHATMGVGLGYAIAAHAAYNSTASEGVSGPRGRKKIVALEGDSAFGFSAMEIETMARYGMDILVFVMNNGGVYHGDSDDAEEWLRLQKATQKGDDLGKGGLRSTSLGYEVGYEKIAEMCGGLGYLARTPEDLEQATRKGWESDRVCVVNVIIEAGRGGKLEFAWQAGGKKKSAKL